VATSESLHGVREQSSGAPWGAGVQKWLVRAVEGGVWLLLLLTPWALGSVLERATALMEGGCFTLLILAWWGGLRREGFRLPSWIVMPAACFCLWTLFQMVPLPPPVLKILSPGTYAAYAEFLPGFTTDDGQADAQSWLLQRHDSPSRALSPRPGEQTGLEGSLRVEPGLRPISWYPWETLRWLSRFLAYGAFFVLVVGFLPERALEKRLPWLVVSSGFALSLIGIVQYLTWNGKIFWVIPVYVGHPFSAWVNSNHFASYAQMSLWLGCGLLLKEAGIGGRQRRHRDFRRRAAPKIALCSFMLVLIAVAIILARSRGTWFSLALGSCVYLYLQARALCRNTRYAAWSVLALTPVVLCIAGITYYILRGSEDYVQETGVEASFAGRINAWQGVLPMIAANPISGTGLGTFSLGYPRYKIYGETAVWDQAHNEYLQAFAESGLIGGAILLWGLVVFWRRRLSPLLSSRWNAQPPVALGAALGVLVLWIHSLVEFNLQIPANGLLFVLLGALVFAAKRRTGRGTESTSFGPPTSAVVSRKSLTDATLTLQGGSDSRILIASPSDISAWTAP